MRAGSFSLRLLISAAAISAAGALPFNIFPLFLSAVADQFQFDSRQLGLVGSSYLAGSSIVALTAIYWMGRAPWRYALAVAIAIILLSIFALGAATQPIALFGSVAIFGGANCVLFSISLTILSRYRDPSRAFGMKLCAEMLLASMVIIAMTAVIIVQFGFLGFLVGLALIYAASALAIFNVPLNAGSTGHEKRGSLPFRRLMRGGRTAWLACVALFVQFAVMSGVWGFLERIGGAFQLAPDLIGTVLSTSLLAGLAAGLGAAVVGGRFGEVTALASALLAIMLALFCLWLGNGLAAYAIGAMLFAGSLQLFAVYQMGLITAVDADETFVTLIPFILASSGALGPWAAGALAAEGDFGAMFITAIILTGVVLIMNIWIGRQKTAAHRIMREV